MTITGKDGIFPDSINRRIAEILPYRNPSTLLGEFTAHGDQANITASGGNILDADSTGIFSYLQTNLIVNNSAYVDGNTQYNRQKEPAFHCRFKLNSNSNVRMFIGLTSRTSAEMVSNAIPNGSYGGLYVDTAAVGSFGTIRGSGGAFVKEFGTLGSSVDTSLHDFYMWMKKSGGLNQVSMQLDNNDRVEYTTTLPSTGALLRYVAGIGNISNLARRIYIAKIAINQEV